jgi:3-hydroxy-9,10-secoandrosta-1,3,5(10)-triene-9,17-dione monooxygenase reductase component
VAENSDPAHGDAQHQNGRFQQVVSSVPTGVTVVATVVGGEPAGTTVASFLMVSRDRRMVGFVPAASSATLSRIRQSGVFCANLLTSRQEEISTAFAVRRGAERFAGVSWRPAPATGSPLLDGVAAWFDCRFTTVHEYGDHVIVVGEVIDFDVASEQMPLVFHRGQYARLEAG